MSAPVWLGSHPKGSDLQSDQDRKTFVNHSYNWHHDGGFMVEFASLMWDYPIPDSVAVSATGFMVDGGVVWSPNGKHLIDMQDGKGVKFTWPVDCTDHIRNLYGQLLWVNPKLYPQQ